eukprot:GHVS01090379.1.p1 GENE.GHVS01090379.1~~GHVS01090379.1.p1  ORF type:complete len:265 (+),score=49.22 GHVS01090379.1:170-964(+)
MALSRGMSCACMRVLLLVALVVGALGIMQVRGLPAQAGSKGGGQEMQAADAVQGGGGGIKENSEEGTFVSSASSTQDSESGKKERKNRFHSKQVDNVGYGELGPGANARKQSARHYIKSYIDDIDKHYIQATVACQFCDDATYSMLMPVVDEYANPPYAWKETRLSGVESITNYMCQQPYLNRKTVYNIMSDEQTEEGDVRFSIEGTIQNLDDPSSPTKSFVQTFLLAANADDLLFFKIRSTTIIFGADKEEALTTKNRYGMDM